MRHALLVSASAAALAILGCERSPESQRGNNNPGQPTTTSGGLGDRHIAQDNQTTMPANQRGTASGDTNSANPSTAPGPHTPPQDRGPLPPPTAPAGTGAGPATGAPPTPK